MYKLKRFYTPPQDKRTRKIANWNRISTIRSILTSERNKFVIYIFLKQTTSRSLTFMFIYTIPTARFISEHANLLPMFSVRLYSSSFFLQGSHMPYSGSLFVPTSVFWPFPRRAFSRRSREYSKSPSTDWAAPVAPSWAASSWRPTVRNLI